MSVTAKNLSKSGARGKDLDVVVREQLQIIDDRLLHADRTWGRNVVTYDLIPNLSLPGLAKKDAQRIVYSSILRSLQKRGFEVALLLEPDASTLFIAWVTDLDMGEIEAMNKVIRDARITREKVPSFVDKGVPKKLPRGPPNGKHLPLTPTAKKVPGAPSPAPTLPSWAAGGGGPVVPPPGRSQQSPTKASGGAASAS